MRILELCTSSGWGGLELYALNISDWFLRQGHECLFVMKSGSMIGERLQDSKLETSSIRPRFKFMPLLAALKLAELIDRQGTQILHVHWNKDLILAVLACLFSKSRPKLVFIRHMALTRHKRDIYHRFIYRHIDAYLVISKRLMAEAKEFLPLAHNKIHLLYHGVADLETADTGFCVQFLAEKKINNHQFRVLLPGRIEHGKGQHILVEAVRQLQQKGIEVEVAMLGHIMDQLYYDNLIDNIKSLNLQTHFHYLGFIDKPTYIYNCFDVIVLTTYAETFGLVLIEGMKCGVPVIGSDAGGVPEIIEHGKTGLLYEPGNAQQLAACLQHLIEDIGLRKTLAMAGQAFADEVFSEEQHHKKLMQVLDSLIEPDIL